MTNRINIQVVGIVVLFQLLTACGGGGGGGGGSGSSSNATPAPTPTPTNVEFQLYKASDFVVGNTQTINLTGSDNQGSSYTATYNLSVKPQSTFMGQLAIPVQLILTLTDTITKASFTVVGTEYYTTDINNLMVLGTVDSLGNVYTPVSIDVLPLKAKIGDAGVIGTYAGSGTATGESVTDTWQLTDAYNGNANFIVNSTTHYYGVFNSSVKTTSVIDQAGNSQSVKVELYIASNNLTVTLTGN